MPGRRPQDPFNAQKRRAGCVAVIVIDAEPRRTAERTLYAKRCREMDQAVRQLKTFETVHKPAFQVWVECEFAADLSEIRYAEAEARDLTELIMEVEKYAEWQGIGYGAAYARILDARAKGNEEELWRDDRPHRHSTADSVDPREGEDWAEAFARDFAAAFSEAVDEAELGQGPTANHAHADVPKDRPSEAATQSADAYLKTLYRQLVRLLHPDLNNDPLDQGLWHEVQDAYTWGDLAKLQALHKRVTGGAAANFEDASIGDLISLRKAIEAKLRQIRQKLKEIERHPAHLHARAATDPALFPQFRRDFAIQIATDLKQALREVRRLRNWISGWKAPRRRRQA